MMKHRDRTDRMASAGRFALAAALSCVLACGPAFDGGAAAAQVSDDAAYGAETGESAAADDAISHASEADAPEESGSSSQDAAPSPPFERVSETAALVATAGQVSADVALSEGDSAPAPAAGTVRSGGLVYEVLPDGAGVALVGWSGAAPSGVLEVPASVLCGGASYPVVKVGGGGGFLRGSDVSSVELPVSVTRVAPDAFAGCASLGRIEVAEGSAAFASFDGMLFDENLEELVAVPEGKRGEAQLPATLARLDPAALSRCPFLASITSPGEGRSL